MEAKRFRLTQEQFDLLWLSALALYFELVVIRWLASEIRAFTIFKNFPLIACYVGLGFGFMRAARSNGTGSSWLFKSFPFLLLAVVAIVGTADWTGLTYILVPGLRVGLYTGWINATHPPANAIANPQLYAAMSIMVFFALFVLVASVMASLGQQLGKLFNSGPALQSYLVNLIGSALGILIFTVLSFQGTPPLVWITTGCLAALWSFRKEKLCMAALVAVIAVTALIPVKSVFETDRDGTKPDIMWSPYHRVDLARSWYDINANERKQVGWQVSANKGYFQQALNLSPEFVSTLPEADRKKLEQFRLDQYELPYFFSKPKRVLIMGAGTGNDVAAALRNGAEHIDAVEIDPKMIELGRKIHPEKPYDSPKVTVYVNDARAFLRQHDDKYDLVMTGFLDSHTVAGNSLSVRLDDYVYTVEGMKDALAHLNPGGVYTMTYCSVVDFLPQRLVNNLRISTGDLGKPLVLNKGDAHIWALVSPATDAMRAKVSDLLPFGYTDFSDMKSDVHPSTDDWPFLYLSPVAFDPLYLAVNACILLLAWAACGKGVRENSKPRRWHLFFLGAAFLLLELAIIDRLALVFGTTWLVNSVCIFAVLFAIIISNMIVIKKPSLMPIPIMYAGLLTSLVIIYFVPIQALNVMGMWTGGSIAAALSVIPIFFAGLIFSTTFQNEDKPSIGLAFNILGAVVGGLLEYVATFTGLRSLLLVAGLLYGISFVILMSGSKKDAGPEGLKSLDQQAD